MPVPISPPRRRPLTKALERRGLKVWLDEQERFGVVVLSTSFFAKHWPQRELDGLVARETSGGAKVILPVWHEIALEEVLEHSPVLAGRLAAKTDGGIDEVAGDVVRAVGVVSDSG